MRYSPSEIESKWQKRWEEERIHEIADHVPGKENFYHLVMFPYPSGDLHIGHWYNFGPADIWARWKRMQGFNVLSPIGFDAFGLPAENAAIQRKLHPRDWTMVNITRMREQLRAMGTIYDWSREVITSDPSYYRWTQWMFEVMWKSGLAERKKVVANWCPKDKTVLANEQVIDGACERCGTIVEQREIEQWVFRITDYAERLLSDLDRIDWPERTKTMQRNWIGKSEGALIKFEIRNSTRLLEGQESEIEAFTTRPDTLFGATYMVLAPDHPLVEKLKASIENWPAVESYIQKTRQKSELERQEDVREKSGVELVGIRAINPANNEEIPVWIADYVLASYGTGAIMAVPAHDERDFEFAKKFNLPIKIVVCPHYPDTTCPILDEAYEGVGHLVGSGAFDGMPSEEAKEKIASFVGGTMKVQYRLRDWIISRQRYWGAPIPMAFCKTCAKAGRGERENMPGWFAVPEKELPVVLPELDDFLPQGDGRSPLAKAKEWLRVKCPGCDADAERETDTMDTFVDSSWYYLRYADSKNTDAFAGAAKLKSWLPVDMYIGGAEHTVLHLLYSRFFTKVLHDKGYLEFDEPFQSLRHQGILLGEDGQKMSKSRPESVVDPGALVRAYGADAVRMYLAFMGPYEQGGPWNPGGISGVTRFLDRVTKLTAGAGEKKTSSDQNNLKRLLARTVAKVGSDISEFHFNTAVSALMIFVNAWEKEPDHVDESDVRTFIRILAPFAPHLVEELWREVIGEETSAHQTDWPKPDVSLLHDELVTVIIQIEGKVRDRVELRIDASKEDVEKLVLERPKVQEWLAGKTPKQFIYVPGRIVNIVLS